MKAIDAANYLVYLMSDICDDLTNMKINKLLYYAQGHYLQKYGVPMFEDRIEAWEHGPVVPEVYNTYKSGGNDPVQAGNAEKPPHIDEKAAEVLFEVARKYGRYTAAALRNMSHAIHSPWDQVYREGVAHIEIPVPLLQTYFSQTEPLERLDIPFQDDDFVGYRGEDGLLVLPEGWNDGAV